MLRTCTGTGEPTPPRVLFALRRRPPRRSRGPSRRHRRHEADGRRAMSFLPCSTWTPTLPRLRLMCSGLPDCPRASSPISCFQLTEIYSLASSLRLVAGCCPFHLHFHRCRDQIHFFVLATPNCCLHGTLACMDAGYVLV